MVFASPSLLLLHLLAVVPACSSLGTIGRDALQFLSELGSWRLAETTGDVRASSILFQRISVVVQRLNSVLLHDVFVDDDRPE